MRGVVGRQLPRTSPASEHVSVLAAAGRPRIEECLSDYKGLENMQNQPSGLKVRIRGIAPQLTITKVRAHVNKATLTDPEEIYLAEGNDAADRIAKSAAEDLLSKPSTAEAEDWERQSRVLTSYLQYVPRALEKWPAVAPSSGRNSLKRRTQPQEGARRRHTFQADVLGEWGARPAEGTTQQDPISADGAASVEDPPPTAQGRPKLGHEWCSRNGTWYCRVFFCVQGHSPTRHQMPRPGPQYGQGRFGPKRTQRTCGPKDRRNGHSAHLQPLRALRGHNAPDQPP